ncbi:pyoverdine biosynthesis protein, partial [bacterium]
NSAIQSLILVKKLTSLSFFNLASIVEGQVGAKVREEMLAPFTDRLSVLKSRVQEHPAHRHLFDGLHRFLFEDQVVLHPEKSRSRVRQECKELTYQTMQRSNAWGRLVGQYFPEALRLSIHPQDAHSEKIGILLSPAVDSWVTPWHGVAVLCDREFLLMKRQQAESLGAELVFHEGLPVHFVLNDSPRVALTAVRKGV